MESASLNELFERYRRAGDAAALGEVFDRTAPELLRLAMHLVRDASEAEDVLQATFVAAIERAEVFDGSRPLTPWLTGILARQAGLARRRRGRATPEPQLELAGEADPAETAQANEFSKELAGALRSLPEPYGEVLRRHLAAGDRPSKIAAELQRAPGTVRMQIHRGLELLRRVLPAGHAAGFAALGSPRGLEALRAEVLAAAVRHGGVGPREADTRSGEGQSSHAAGPKLAKAPPPSFALPPPALAAILVAAAAAVGLWLAGDRGPGPRPPEAPLISAAEAPPASPTAGAGEGAEELAERTGVTGVALAPAGVGVQRAWLAGTLVSHGVADLEAAELTVRGLARFTLLEELAVRGRPDAAGVFRIDLGPVLAAARPGRPIEELSVRVEHPRAAVEELRVPLLFGADVTRDPSGDLVYSARVELNAAGTLEGRVLPLRSGDLPAAENGASSAVALLFELKDGRPLLPAVDRRECAPGDEFVLRARVAAPHALLVVARGTAPRTLLVEPSPGHATPVGSIALEPGATIEGATSSAGRPLGAGALVSAFTQLADDLFAVEGARLAWTGEAFTTAGGAAETDASGRFTIAGLSPGPYRVGVSRAARPARGPEPKRISVDSAGWTEVVAPCRALEVEARLVRLAITVDAADAPENFLARVRVEQGAPFDGGTERGDDAADPDGARGAGPRGTFTEANVAARERLEVSVAPSVPCRVIVSGAGFLPEVRSLDARDIGGADAGGAEIALDVTLRRDPSVAGATVRLLLPEDLGGGPACEEATFEFTPLDREGASGAPVLRRLASADGTFVLDGLPAGRGRMRAFAIGAYEHHLAHWCDASAELVLPAGVSTELQFTLVRGGSLQLEAFRAARQPVAAACRIQRPGGPDLDVAFLARGVGRSTRSNTHTTELGPAEVWPILAPGEYDVSWSVPGFRPATTRVRLAAGERARVSVVLEPEEAVR